VVALELGEAGKLHVHMISRLWVVTIWGLVREVLDWGRGRYGLIRSEVEPVRDSYGLAGYLSLECAAGETIGEKCRTFECKRRGFAVQRFHRYMQSAEWLAGIEAFLALQGCGDKAELRLKLGPFWAYNNAYTIGRLGREALKKRQNI
jgi:hypothetical protein